MAVERARIGVYRQTKCLRRAVGGDVIVGWPDPGNMGAAMPKRIECVGDRSPITGDHLHFILRSLPDLHSGRTAMTGKRNETLATHLKYPMVDLFTGGTVMPLMFVNVVTTWYLLSLTAPWALMEAWLKARESERAS